MAKRNLMCCIFTYPARKYRTGEIPTRSPKPWKHMLYECSVTIIKVSVLCSFSQSCSFVYFLIKVCDNDNFRDVIEETNLVIQVSRST